MQKTQALWAIKLTVMVVVVFSGCRDRGFKEIGDEDSSYDSELAKKCDLVIRGKLIERIGGSKYQWSRVKVVQEYKNATNTNTNDATIVVGHYCKNTGIPGGKSTFYLNSFDNDSSDSFWMLLGESGDVGISHSSQ